MGNALIEFFRMFFSYLLLMVVCVAVAGAGGFVGLKVWKPKQKVEKTETKTQE